MVSLDSPTESKRPTALAIFLIVAGVIGWLAAFALTLDKFTVLEHPTAQLTCNINPLVGCSKNLASWQGSVLGFPNPLIGVACWAAPIAVGVAILAGARFKRWFWMLFNLGVLGAIVLVISTLIILFGRRALRRADGAVEDVEQQAEAIGIGDAD